jgi:CRP-like cAMP-binding protein
MEGLYDYIKQFAVLDRQEFELLAQMLEVKHYDKKTVVTNIGETENYLYFVSSGLVRKYFIHGKKEINTQLAAENELICSSVSFLSRKPSSYIIETLEPSLLLRLSFDNMEKIYQMGPRMNRLGRLIIIDWLVQKEAWEHDRIKQNPRERFVNFVRQNAVLVQRVPQKHLASYLNMKPETYSRYKHLLSK